MILRGINTKIVTEVEVQVQKEITSQNIKVRVEKETKVRNGEIELLVLTKTIVKNKEN